MKNRAWVRGLGILTVVVGAFAARPVEARLIDLHAGGYGAGMTGWGTTTATPDFFERRQGLGLGVGVGAKLLIFDAQVNFTQLFDGNGRAGTLTQILAGINIDVGVGRQLFTDGIEKGKSRNVLRPILNGGFAFGTPEPVHKQLDNAQISHKGVIAYMGLGFEHFLNEFVGVGAEVDYGYHYFIKGEASEAMPATPPPATTSILQQHSAGYQLTGFATLTFHLGY